MFTADGLIQLGGSLVPRRISPSEVCFHVVKFEGDMSVLC